MGVFKRKDKDGVKGDTWYVDFYDPRGKRITRAIGPSKREAEAYLGKVRASIREKRFFDIKQESKVTFDELLNQYIPKIQEQKFYQNSLRYIIPALREYFGKKFLSEIDYKMLEDFRDERKKTPTQHNTERSNRTVNIEMAFLRRIFRRALKWGILERSPFEHGEDLFYKNTIRRERALTEDEVKRLVEACPAKACNGFLRPMVITAIYTGLRKSDIFNLEWSSVDLEKNFIRLVEAKTGKTRNIVLNRDMITLLQSLPRKGKYIFQNKNGKPFRDTKKSFLRALKKAGIKQSEDRRQKIVFHTLRHTCVSLLTERGADTTMVKNYVAHASEEMTKHYTHLSAEFSRKTADILNGLCRVIPLSGNNLEALNEKDETPENLAFPTV